MDRDMTRRRRVLNVGGNNKSIPIPSHYDGWEHLLLDIDLSGEPDLHMDALDMKELEPAQFDAVYCSHNLEHFYRAEVPELLQGMRHVLTEDGFVEVLVPDFRQLTEEIARRNLDIDDVLYPDFRNSTLILGKLPHFLCVTS